jgi:ABC-type thiamine transport system substrate-binding protein
VSAPVAALKTLPQRFRWLRKRPTDEEAEAEAEDEDEDEDAWRQRWIATLRRDIEAANAVAPSSSSS